MITAKKMPSDDLELCRLSYKDDSGTAEDCTIHRLLCHIAQLEKAKAERSVKPATMARKRHK